MVFSKKEIRSSFQIGSLRLVDMFSLWVRWLVWGEGERVDL